MRILMLIASLNEGFLTSPSIKTFFNSVYPLPYVAAIMSNFSQTPLQVNSFHPSHLNDYIKIKMHIFNSI